MSLRRSELPPAALDQFGRSAVVGPSQPSRGKMAEAVADGSTADRQRLGPAPIRVDGVSSGTAMSSPSRSAARGSVPTVRSCLICTMSSDVSMASRCTTARSARGSAPTVRGQIRSASLARCPVVVIEPAAEMQELRGAVAVARYRCPKRDLTEVLQHVEGEEPRVSGLPASCGGMRVGRKRAESQEVARRRT